MAANTKVVLENLVDGYLAEAGQIKGSYVTVQTITERNNLSPTAIVTGSRCYVSNESKTYQWNGTTWVEISEDWEFTLEDGSTVTKRIAVMNIE